MLAGFVVWRRTYIKMRLYARRICTLCVFLTVFTLGVYYVHIGLNDNSLHITSTRSSISDTPDRTATHTDTSDLSVPYSQIIGNDTAGERPNVTPSNRVLPVGNNTSSRNKLIELKDIFISVKTTYIHHKTRLQLILDTWFSFARNQVFFFTDIDDPDYSKKTSNHLINTNCTASHHRLALCCKMSVEYDTFLKYKKPWFCHLDDDTYLHVPNLLRLLREYDHRKDWYIGRPSLNHPLHLSKIQGRLPSVSFWFATGGAGYCISRALALKMIPYASGGKFKTMCHETDLPDDCSIGYVIYRYLNQKLTTNERFHSHLEPLFSVKHLEDQITFSYGKFGGRPNTVKIDGFPMQTDPTRFRSLNCYFYPSMKDCAQLKNSKLTKS